MSVDGQYRSATRVFQQRRNEAEAAEALRAALVGCIEHMEWSTPQGKAAYEAAKIALRLCSA